MGSRARADFGDEVVAELPQVPALYVLVLLFIPEFI
tara:strand:+ start:18988 stop:19095 length:108 start_codon:yes stop_codon:yes gene_type:complete